MYRLYSEILKCVLIIIKTSNRKLYAMCRRTGCVNAYDREDTVAIVKNDSYFQTLLSQKEKKENTAYSISCFALAKDSLRSSDIIGNHSET